MNETSYIKALDSTAKQTEPAIRKVLEWLKLPEGSKVLDVPCGTGNHMKWMLEAYPDTHITGVDIAREHVLYAKSKLNQAGKGDSCQFTVGDMNNLEFDNNTFDLVWCCDGLWPGPKEVGCPAEQPYDILNHMVRVTKPGGKIAILFWSSQRLLPGYPKIEAALNNSDYALRPWSEKQSPEMHFTYTPVWLKKVGLSNIQIKTFATDIKAPENQLEKEGLQLLFDMFWGESEAQVSKEIWKKFKSLTNSKSDEFILNNESYAGILTYTIYTGIVPE